MTLSVETDKNRVKNRLGLKFVTETISVSDNWRLLVLRHVIFPLKKRVIILPNAYFYCH